MDQATPNAVHGLERWKVVVLGTFHAFTQPDTSLRCAATAFFGFLSIFPMLATIALVYGMIANQTLVAGTVASLDHLLPAAALSVITDQLNALAARPRGSLGIGLLISIPVALWSGSRGVDALLFSISRVRGEPHKRGLILNVLVAIGLTVGGSLFVLVALLAIAGLPALLSGQSDAEALVLLLRWPILLGLAVLALAVLYRWGPDRHPRRFRFIWPGAILAALLWVLVGTLFSLYVQNWGHLDVTFGSVAAAVVLMLWLYNSAQIVVLGAALNAEIERSASR